MPASTTCSTAPDGSLARVLLRWLVAVFVADGPVVVGIDETIERRWGPKISARGIYRDPVRSSRGHFVKASGLRWGPKISARGIYRDPVRSSRGHFVKASGLRWVSVMLLAPIPGAGRIWGLPDGSRPSGTACPAGATSRWPTGAGSCCF